MFGYVVANSGELSEAEKARYGAVYCGICRRIRIRAGNAARLGLSYDMSFLALLLMSLYEPEEEFGEKACSLHPIKPRPWVDNEYIAYAADMNVALAYYNCQDDWEDDKKLSAKIMAGVFKKRLSDIEEEYPRQCAAIRDCIARLSELEKEGCKNADTVAGVFGTLMGELLVYRGDLWADTLFQMGSALGRFIYLMDAALDFDKDEKKGCYNPFLAMGQGKDPQRWEEYLVLTMGRCTDYYERLPLVQDKGLLDNILYSGVWGMYRGKRKEEERAK